MTNVQSGVVSRFASYSNLRIVGNHIAAKSLGISVSELQADPNQCVVLENVVEMSGNPSAKGISIGLGKPLSGSTTGTQVSNNIVKMNEGFDGIWMGWAQSSTVDRNRVELTNGSNRTGIRIDAGYGNTVKCNTITGTGSFADAKGIHGLLPTGPSSFLCNTVNGATVGLSFEGVAVGHTGSVPISGNRMNNSTDAGLLLGADAVVGPQVHRGNRWVNSGGFTVATHLGSNALAVNSLFTVDAIENPTFLPGFVDPPEWFIDVNNPATSYICDPVALCPISQIGGDGATDRKIARGDLPGLAHPAAQIWLAQRRLAERIHTDGNPYPGDTDLNNFIAASQTNGLAAYAQVQVGLRQLFSLSAAAQAQMDAFEAQTELAQPLLEQAERMFYSYNISIPDSLYWLHQRDSLQQVLEGIKADRDAQLNQIVASRIQTASDLNTLNTSLTGNAVWQVNERTVNDIYLNTLGRNIPDLTAGQQATLESIAAQCPVADGEAVLRARALLTLVQDAPVAYDDAILCIGRSQQGMSATLNGLVRVYPNPASDHLIVDYQLSTDAEHRISLFNVYGQEVLSQVLPERSGQLKLPVVSLTNGMYWHRVWNGQSSFSTGKILIQH